MGKISFFALIILFINLSGLSQGNQNFDPQVNAIVPRFFPSPPNASALTKFSGTDVALNSGMIKFDIPLYTLSAGKLSVPISLSYSSNGVRVDEYPSLTGMSWALNAGGVITRTLYGAKDEGATRHTIDDNAPQQQMYDFVYQYNNPHWNSSADTEADLFSYNFLNYNGKFVFDENMDPVLLPYSNLKIEKDFNSSAYTFKITDAYGFKYYFGGNSATEETKSENSAYIPGQNNPAPVFIKTAYYLNKIESPTGETAYFDYNAYEHMYNAQGVTQTNNHILTFGGLCPPPCPDYFSSVRYFGQWKSKILSQIRILNWGTVSFSYSTYYVNKFSLSSFESYKILNGIVVKDKNNFTIKSINLSYNIVETNLYPNQYAGEGGTPIYTYRPFLSEVVSGSDKYQFEYYTPEQLPVITSFSQDHWGFYNGVYNAWFISNFGNPWAYPQATANRNPNPAYAVNGMLKKITHPTGGSETIEYEGNMMGSTVTGGMRVKRISIKESENAQEIIRRIYYGPYSALNSNTGLAATPWLDKTITNGIVCTVENNPGYPWPVLGTCQFSRRTSNTANNLGIFNGGIIAYTHVTESIGGDNFENGGIEHQYLRSHNTYSYPLVNGSIYDGPLNYTTRLHGLETYTKVFKIDGSIVITLSETFNSYGTSSLYYQEVKSLNVVCRWVYAVVPDLDGYDVNKTMYESWWEILNQTVTKTYDENGENPVTIIKNYYYEDVTHLQPTKIITTDSKGNITEAHYKYPADFASSSNPNIYNEMLLRNMKAIPLQKTDYKASALLSDIKLSYRSSNQVPMPDKVESSIYSNSLQLDLMYDNYDSKGNILQFTARDGVINSIIYDYFSFLPVAEVKNAPYNQVAFTSFEADGKGGWSYTGSAITENTAPTGKKIYSLLNNPVSKSTLLPNTFIVSYWSRNGPQNVNNTSFVSGETIGDWTYYEHKIVNPSNGTITVSGSGTIDELRLYPEKALMTTYTYIPLIGISSICDPNNRISYYEYDGFNRLALIRDQHKKIIKKICYKYYNQQEDCSSPCDPTPDWQNIGSPTCQQGSCGNSGYQIQQQQDINPCSPTYNQTQNITIYNPSACPPATGVFITYEVISWASGFTAVYTSNTTGFQYTFPIPTGTGTLGCIPADSYSLSISKPGNISGYLFGSGCQFTTGTSAYWSKVLVSESACNHITISFEQQ